MHETNKKSYSGGLDRIAIAWAIQIAVILWVALGAVDHCTRVDQVNFECRTTVGEVGLHVPAWFGR